MADAKRYFLYARKSTDVEDKQVRSIDAQLSELHEFAKRNAVTISEIIIERESAKTPGKRREFNSMLDRIERGEANGIISWHPDRLARNMTDGGRVIDLIDTGKLTALLFPTFWFDTTPQGKFMLSMAFSQSKFYVDSLSVNTRMGLMEKVRRGEYPGFAPIGYLNDRRVKRIIPDPDRAAIVKQAFERYADGSETLETIRQLFATHGVRTNTGKLVTNGFVTRMLKNPLYYGQFRYAGEVYNGTHEALISKRLFDAANSVLQKRFRSSQSRKSIVPKAFTNLLHCAECGRPITAEIQKGHTYYRCTKTNKAVRCTQPYIREEMLDSEISRILSPYNLPKDWADAMLARIDDDERMASKESVSLIAKKQTQIKGLQLKTSRLLEMRIDGEIEAKSYVIQKAKIMSQTRTLEEDITSMIKGQKPWLEPLKNWILEAKNLHEIATTGSLSEKKGMAKNIFGSNLFLDRKKARGKAVKPWAFLADNVLSHDVVHLLDAIRTFYQDNQGSQSI